MHPHSRTASTLIAIFGAITHTVVTIQVLATWRTFKWEPESEWESSGDKWQIDGLKLIWALLLVYFSSAASVCTVGLVGILKARTQTLCLFLLVFTLFNRINHPSFASTVTIQLRISPFVPSLSF